VRANTVGFEQQKPTQRANIVNCLCGCAQSFDLACKRERWYCNV